MEENKDRESPREKIRFSGWYGEEPERNKSWLRQTWERLKKKKVALFSAVRRELRIHSME